MLGTARLPVIRKDSFARCCRCGPCAFAPANTPIAILRLLRFHHGLRHRDDRAAADDPVTADQRQERLKAEEDLGPA